MFACQVCFSVLLNTWRLEDLSPKRADTFTFNINTDVCCPCWTHRCVEKWLYCVFSSVEPQEEPVTICHCDGRACRILFKVYLYASCLSREWKYKCYHVFQRLNVFSFLKRGDDITRDGKHMQIRTTYCVCLVLVNFFFVFRCQCSHTHTHNICNIMCESMCVQSHWLCCVLTR